jgi:uncharacterized membrane protein
MTRCDFKKGNSETFVIIFLFFTSISLIAQTRTQEMSQQLQSSRLIDENSKLLQVCEELKRENLRLKEWQSKAEVTNFPRTHVSKTVINSSFKYFHSLKVILNFFSEKQYSKYLFAARLPNQLAI